MNNGLAFVVSDTGPILTFLKINRIDILEKIFSKIYIPPEVYREITSNENFIKESEIIKNCNFITVKEVKNIDMVNQLKKFLDSGESEAIILTEEIGNDAILIIDDKKGREYVANKGILNIGAIGVLARAIDENIVTKQEIIQYIQIMKETKRRYDNGLYDFLLNRFDRDLQNNINQSNEKTVEIFSKENNIKDEFIKALIDFKNSKEIF